MSFIPILSDSVGRRVRYLLRDEFTTARAAGAVNGTAAEPGPGNRTATDTNGILSLAGGAAVWAGAPANNNGLLYADIPIARTSGRILLWQFQTATAVGNGNEHMGFLRTAALSAAYANTWQPATSAINSAAENNSSKVDTGAIAYASVPIRWAIILRTAGAYYFCKESGGAWTLKFIYNADTTATVYVAFRFSTNALNFTMDSVRVPVPTWLPTPIAYDTFTRANGALGSSEIVGPDAQAVPARVWTGATWAIATNAAVNTPTEGGELATGTLTIGTWYRITATQANYFYVGCAINDTFRATAATALDANNKVVPFTLSTLFASLTDGATDNVKVRAQIGALTAKKQAGVAARLDSAATPTAGVILYFDGSGNCKVEEMVGGVWQATILSVVKAFTASDWLELDLSGTAYRCYHITNAGVATLLGSGVVTTATGTLHGLFSTYASNTVLGMEVWPKAGTAYSALDGF